MPKRIERQSTRQENASNAILFFFVMTEKKQEKVGFDAVRKFLLGQPHPLWLWIRANGFILGLFSAVVLAFLFPGPGARGGWLQPELLNNAGVALILFLQGLSLAFEKIKSGFSNWKLHVIILSFTFVIFPLVGVLFDFFVPQVWKSEPAAVRDGFLYLCVLPSTISTSVVLTAVAKGNTPGALFNAALSNILGVVFTPVLVHLLMQSTGQQGNFGGMLLKITLLTLLPFVAGMGLRCFVSRGVERHKKWVARVCNLVVVSFVYTAFCDSVEAKIWNSYGMALTVQTLFVVIVLFSFVSVLIYIVSRLARLNREDGIAAYFCSIKKTLAMGVPLAVLIFGERDDVSLILLPIMFYHPFQLFVNGLFANRWAKGR